MMPLGGRHSRVDVECEEEEEDSLGWVSSVSSSEEEEEEEEETENFLGKKDIGKSMLLFQESRAEEWSLILKKVARERVSEKRHGNVLERGRNTCIYINFQRVRIVWNNKKEKDSTVVLKQVENEKLGIEIKGSAWRQEYIGLIDEKFLGLHASSDLMKENTDGHWCLVGPRAGRVSTCLADIIFYELSKRQEKECYFQVVGIRKKKEEREIGFFCDIPKDLNRARFRRILAKAQNAFCKKDDLKFLFVVNNDSRLEFSLMHTQEKNVDVAQFDLRIACISATQPGLDVLATLYEISEEARAADFVSFQAAKADVEKPRRRVADLRLRDDYAEEDVSTKKDKENEFKKKIQQGVFYLQTQNASQSTKFVDNDDDDFIVFEEEEEEEEKEKLVYIEDREGNQKEKSVDEEESERGAEHLYSSPSSSSSSSSSSPAQDKNELTLFADEAMSLQSKLRSPKPQENTQENSIHLKLRQSHLPPRLEQQQQQQQQQEEEAQQLIEASLQTSETATASSPHLAATERKSLLHALERTQEKNLYECLQIKSVQVETAEAQALMSKETIGMMSNRIKRLEERALELKQENQVLQEAKLAADAANTSALVLLDTSEAQASLALTSLEARAQDLESLVETSKIEAKKNEILYQQRAAAAAAETVEHEHKAASQTIDRIRKAAAQELEEALTEIRASVAAQAEAARRALKTLAEERDALSQARIEDQAQLHVMRRRVHDLEMQQLTAAAAAAAEEEEQKNKTQVAAKRHISQEIIVDPHKVTHKNTSTTNSNDVEALEFNLREKQRELDELRATSRREAAALWLAVGKTDSHLHTTSTLATPSHGDHHHHHHHNNISSTMLPESKSIPPSADELALTAELSSLDQRLAGLRTHGDTTPPPPPPPPAKTFRPTAHNRQKSLGPKQTVDRVEKTNKEVLDFLELSSTANESSQKILSPSRVLRNATYHRDSLLTPTEKSQKQAKDHHEEDDDDDEENSYEPDTLSIIQQQTMPYSNTFSTDRRISNASSIISTSRTQRRRKHQSYSFLHPGSKNKKISVPSSPLRTPRAPALTVHSFPSTLRSGEEYSPNGTSSTITSNNRNSIVSSSSIQHYDNNNNNNHHHQNNSNSSSSGRRKKKL